MLRNRHAVLLGVAALMSVLPSAPPAVLAQADELCFTQTNQCIDGRLRAFWEQNGAVAVFGYPIAAPAEEINPDTLQSSLTQWFERHRFELHPENNRPYDVLLSRLGAARLASQGRSYHGQPRESGPRDGCLWFERTGYNVCDFDPGGASAADRGFLSYWQAYGLADPQLDVYQRSLALYGHPISAPSMETNASGDTVLTQWFERARFEWHPGNPAGFRVLLGLLGDELLIEPPPQPALPGNVPWVTVASGVLALSEDRPTITLPGGVGWPVLGSPNGRYLAFQTAAVYVTENQASKYVIRDVTSGAETDHYLGYQRMIDAVWSPDGTQLAFTTLNGRDAVWDLRVMNAASGNVRDVLADQPTSVPLLPLAWTGEGIWATAYLPHPRNTAGPQGLQIVDPATGASVEVSREMYSAISVSPDGRRVALQAYRNPFAQTASSELSVLDRGTGAQTTVVPLVENAYFSSTLWSPDGNRLVYVRHYADSGTPPTLHVINADGSGEQVLPFGPPELGVLSDVVWRDTTTLQLLMNRRIGKTVDDHTLLGELLEISLDSFTPEQVRLVTQVPGGAGSFVYSPRQN